MLANTGNIALKQIKFSQTNEQIKEIYRLVNSGNIAFIQIPC